LNNLIKEFTVNRLKKLPNLWPSAGSDCDLKLEKY